MASRRVNDWDVSVFFDGENFYAHLKLDRGLQISNAKTYGINNLSPFQPLRVEKVDGNYAVIGISLMGGGNSCFGKMPTTPTTENTRQSSAEVEINKVESKSKVNSMLPENLNPRNVGRLASQIGLPVIEVELIDDNQAPEVEYVDAIIDSVRRGNFAGLPLKELQDVPLMTVEAPLYIATVLLETLNENTIWADPFLFQIRYTLARMVRRYLFYYIIRKPTAYESMQTKVYYLTNEIEAMLNSKDRKFALDSGVLAEFIIIADMIDQLKTNQRWSTTLVDNAEIISEKIFVKNPQPLSPEFMNILDELRSETIKETFFVQALLIERLYMIDGQEALREFAGIMDLEQPWEIRFLALAYIEWGLHRGLIWPDKFLKLTIEKQIALNDNNVNQMLVTLLMKLNWQNMFSKFKQGGQELEYFKKFSKQDPEPKEAVLSNLPERLIEVVGRDQEVEQVIEMLLEKKSAVIVGQAGVGKSTLGWAVASSLLCKFDIVWYCYGQDPISLESSLQSLANILNVQAIAKEHYQDLKSKLITMRVLLLIDNTKLYSEIYQVFREAEVHLLITTDTPVRLANDGNANNSYLLTEWKEEAAIGFLAQGLENTYDKREIKQFVRKLTCVPLALKILKGFVEMKKFPLSEFLQKQSLSKAYFDYDPVRFLIKGSLVKAFELYPDMCSVMCLRALLSADSVPDDIFEALARDLQDELDFSKCFRKAKSYSLIDTAKKSSSMHRLVQSVVLQTCQASVKGLLDLITRSIQKQLNATTDRIELLRSTWSVLGYIIINDCISDFVPFAIDLLYYCVIAQGTGTASNAVLFTIIQATHLKKSPMEALNLAKISYMLNKAGDRKTASEYANAAIRGIGDDEHDGIRVKVYGILGLQQRKLNSR